MNGQVDGQANEQWIGHERGLIKLRWDEPMRLDDERATLTVNAVIIKVTCPSAPRLGLGC